MTCAFHSLLLLLVTRDLGCRERPGGSVFTSSLSSYSLDRPVLADFDTGSGSFNWLVCAYDEPFIFRQLPGSPFRFHLSLTVSAKSMVYRILIGAFHNPVTNELAPLGFQSPQARLAKLPTSRLLARVVEQFVPEHNFRVAHDPGTMSGFAPRIVDRLARICSAYDALFESFGLI
jgi:hypothetical protein